MPAPAVREAHETVWETGGTSIQPAAVRFHHQGALAVATTYLRRLEGQEDKGWGRVAEAIGLTPAEVRTAN